MRKIFLFIFAFVFVSLFAGCETTKNTHRIAAGVADDVYNTGRNLQKADDWVQENAW